MNLEQYEPRKTVFKHILDELQNLPGFHTIIEPVTNYLKRISLLP
jgi:hypothetical protein